MLERQRDRARASGTRRRRPRRARRAAGSARRWWITASPSVRTGSGTSAPRSMASAKCCCRRSSVSAAAAAARPTSSVPVTIQVGACASTLVAATRPAPARSVRTGLPSESSSDDRVAGARRPREHAAGAAGRARAGARRRPGARPTSGRRPRAGPPRRPTARSPSARRAVDARRRQPRRSPRRTSARRRRRRRAGPGSACPPGRSRTARGRSRRRRGPAARPPTSWWSHHTRSPALSAALGRADGRLDAVDVVEPVGAAAVVAAARDAVDLLHEAAAVAGLDVVGALQHAHHRVAAPVAVSSSTPSCRRSLPKSRVTVSVTSPVDSPSPKPQPGAGPRTARGEPSQPHPTVTSTREGSHQAVAGRLAARCSPGSAGTVRTARAGRVR